MQLTSFAAVALLAHNAAAQSQNMLRFACSQLVVERLDPLVDPGMVYTPHLHQIVGGNSFNTTMDPTTHDLVSQSTCTSCTFAEDFSNYWTAVMFFKAKNGTYKRVKQIGNAGPQGQLVNNGGLDVYYMPGSMGTDAAFQAFKPGFRMLAGNAANTNPKSVKSSAICHRCWNKPSETTFVGGAPCSGSDTVDIPSSKDCNFIRQTIIFPSCWNGKDLDSPDHQSHVAYPKSGGLYQSPSASQCPTGFPVVLPTIMYELMWDATEFVKDPNAWPTDGSNPYVYSMNIGGPAAHGDYVFGWKDKSLAKAMDFKNNKCGLNTDCAAAGLHAQTPTAYSACTKKQTATEDVDGWLKALPLGSKAIKA